MITVTISWSTNLLAITGERRNSIQVADGCTVRELLDTLSEKYGFEFAKIRLGENPHIHMVLNKRSINKDAFETKLSDGDSLFISTLAGGG